MSEARVALVSMPFGAVGAPSIQLGLLKAECREAGIPVNCLEFGLDFERLIGDRLYRALSYMGDTLLGEWVFAKSAFPGFTRADRYPSRFRHCIEHVSKMANTTPEALSRLYDTVAPAFVTRVAQSLRQYDVVGFSSTFQQNVASLAVARLLKEARPETITVFGGANFEGRMGAAYMRAFPWVDVVVSGEADEVIGPLLRALLGAGRAPVMAGVYQRDNGSVPPDAGTHRLTYRGDLNALPFPDYDDYFDRLAALKLNSGERAGEIALPFESSRGCWWGQKHHCTFCGLNGGGMTYRAKTPQRVTDEISALATKYQVATLNATDNIISTKGLDEFCALIKRKIPGLRLFYEVKANLKPDTIRQMAEAGMTRMQPGIESLSDHVLSLMRKGTTGINNLNTLRWFAMYGIETSWNLLYGFPGETDHDYLEQRRLIRTIHHLEPPATVARIRIDRFSPNLESPALRERFVGLKPIEPYYYVYPETLDYESAAYFFEGQARDAVSEDLMDEIAADVGQWRRKWGRSAQLDAFGEQLDVPTPFLWATANAAGLEISDGRDNPASPRKIQLSSDEQRVYEAIFDKPVSVDQLVARFPDADLDRCLDLFESNALVYRVNHRILALALIQNPSQRPAAASADDAAELRAARPFEHAVSGISSAK